MKEVLGDDPGPCIVDGYSGYAFIRILQRCFAHLLREVDDVRNESDEGAALADAVHDVFERLKSNLPKGPPGPEHRRLKGQLGAELAALVEQYRGVQSVAKPVTYLEGGLGSWTTCLLPQGMPPTNKAPEQGLSGHVIMRKIMGSFRSPEGVQGYETIGTLVDTWRFSDQNPYNELESLLRREL